MAKIKSLRKALNAVTTTWINSSLSINCSTGEISAVGPLDEFEIDSSIQQYNKYERPRTTLLIDYDQLVLSAEFTGNERCITDVRLEELGQQLSAPSVYSHLYELLEKAKNDDF